MTKHLLLGFYASMRKNGRTHRTEALPKAHGLTVHQGR